MSLTRDDVAELRAELGATRQVLERLEARLAEVEPERPLSTWNEVAEAVGVSPDTLKRRREARGDKTPPTFGSGDEARRWYRRLVAGDAVPQRRRSTQRTAPKGELTLADLKAGKS